MDRFRMAARLDRAAEVANELRLMQSAHLRPGVISSQRRAGIRRQEPVVEVLLPRPVLFSAFACDEEISETKRLLHLGADTYVIRGGRATGGAAGEACGQGRPHGFAVNVAAGALEIPNAARANVQRREQTEAEIVSLPAHAFA